MDKIKLGHRKEVLATNGQQKGISLCPPIIIKDHGSGYTIKVVILC